MDSSPGFRPASAGGTLENNVIEFGLERARAYDEEFRYVLANNEENLHRSTRRSRRGGKPGRNIPVGV
jgi:hypothetical protein